MKTTQDRKGVKKNFSPKGHAGSKQRFDPAEITFETKPEPSHIQWLTSEQIQEVSRRLVRINRTGIRWEAKGDYFNSGDLAYQLQEIIKSTEDLFRKTQRIKYHDE